MTSLQLTMTLWLALLAVAASSDVASRRIPNAVVVPIAALGLLARFDGGGIASAGSGAAAGAGLGALLVLAWKRGLFGGGDVKLTAAAACGLGVARLPEFLLATALAGGALAVTVLGVDRVARSSLRTSAAGLVLGTSTPSRFAAGSGRTVPYGAAIAVGAAYALRSGGMG